MGSGITHNENARMFPDLDDHTIVEILGLHPSTTDLEFVWQSLQGDEETLAEVRQRDYSQINALIDIIQHAILDQEDDQ